MKHSREEYVYLAKIYDRAEKYDDMIKYIRKFIEMDPNLSVEERDIFSAGFKNLISSKRSSFRILQLLEKKEQKKKSPNLASLNEVKNTVENEINKICDKILNILNDYLLPAADVYDKEDFVFYLKLQGDYFRYKAEISNQSDLNDFHNLLCEAEQAYQKAYEIAESELHISNPIRLGVALNFSVFCYEIANQKEEAIEIAKMAFEESMKVLDELERNKAKDTIIIIQILKENLILWNNELMEMDD